MFLKKSYPGDVEKDVCYRSERSEPTFEESIAERTKLKRQKIYIYCR